MADTPECRFCAMMHRRAQAAESKLIAIYRGVDVDRASSLVRLANHKVFRMRVREWRRLRRRERKRIDRDLAHQRALGSAYAQEVCRLYLALALVSKRLRDAPKAHPRDALIATVDAALENRQLADALARIDAEFERQAPREGA